MVNFALWLKKEGYSEHTVEGRIKHSKYSPKTFKTLLDGDKVREWLTRSRLMGSTKLWFAKNYQAFASWKSF